MAAAVCALAIYTSSTLNSVLAALNQNTQTRLIAESGSAMSAVSGDEIQVLIDGKSTTSTTFAAVQNRLYAFVGLHDIQAIYFAYKVNSGQMQYVIGAGAAQTYNLKSNPVPINELANQAFRGIVATTPLHEYPIGSAQPDALMVYTPIYDSKGEVVAIACVEISDALFVDASRQIRTLILVFIGGIFLIILAGCINVLVQARKENILQQQLDQQRLMARISQSFISQRNINELVSDALRQTGEFLGVSRVFLALTDSDTNQRHIEYSWFSDPSLSPTGEGVKADGSISDEAISRAEKMAEMRAVFHEAVRQTFPLSLGDSHRMSIIFCSDTKLNYDKKYLSLAEKGIRSFAWAPIYFKGTLWGVLSIESLKRRRRWNEHEEQLVVNVSGVLNGIIARHQIDKERVSALERAIQANNAKSDFLSNMSHEVRTPLNAIMGMTKIAESSDDPERKDYCLGKINEASLHLLGIINNVLDMSTIESNQLVLSPAAFYFEEAVREALDTVEPDVIKRSQILAAELDCRLPAILIGDRKRFIQVLVNLLANAVKFTPEEGNILLRIRLQELRGDVCVLRVEVTDTGIGIDEDQQKRLFYSFEQVENGNSRRYGGMGLGLAISRNLIEMMHGTIGVSSKPGEGSTFYFTVEMLYGTQQDLPKTEAPATETTETGEAGMEAKGTEARGTEARAETGEMGMEARAETETKAVFAPVAAASVAAPVVAAPAVAAPVAATPVADTPDATLSDTPNEEISVADDEISVATTDMSVPALPEGAAALSCAEKRRNPDLSAYRILLVEDININIEIVVALLEPTGIKIDVAANGLEALQKIRNDIGSYDLIFMDMQMPEMDGLSATRYIRDLPDPRARQIPIIAMTANVFKTDIEKTLAAGMDGHIGKPLNLDELLGLLETFLLEKS